MYGTYELLDQAKLDLLLGFVNWVDEYWTSAGVCKNFTKYHFGEFMDSASWNEKI